MKLFKQLYRITKDRYNHYDIHFRKNCFAFWEYIGGVTSIEDAYTRIESDKKHRSNRKFVEYVE